MKKIVLVTLTILSVLAISGCNNQDIAKATFDDSALIMCTSDSSENTCDIEALEDTVYAFIIQYEDYIHYDTIESVIYSSSHLQINIHAEGIDESELTSQYAKEINVIMSHLYDVINDNANNVYFGVSMTLDFSNGASLVISDSSNEEAGRVELFYYGERNQDNTLKYDLLDVYEMAIAIIKEFDSNTYRSRYVEAYIYDGTLILQLLDNTYEVFRRGDAISAEGLEWEDQIEIVKKYFPTYVEGDGGV